jgi:predicted NBD/HSP70 family sugar kinase
MNTEKLIGVEVSKSSFKAVCVEKDGTLSDAFKIPIEDGQDLFPQLNNFISQAKERMGEFEKLGVAVPGLLHQRTKRIAVSTHNPEHEKIDFLGQLEATTNLKITVLRKSNKVCCRRREAMSKLLWSKPLTKPNSLFSKRKSSRY